MLSAQNLRKWFLRQPHAETIRMTVGDGVIQEIKPTRNQSWAKISETVHAIAPELIELLDKDDRIIRAMRPGEETESNTSAPTPPAPITTDPETARLTHFANLIHRAYEHSVNVAFEKMASLMEAMNQRSDSIEARLERAEAAYRRVAADQLKDAWDRVYEASEAAENGDLKDQMLLSFLHGASARKPPAPRANGNGKAE
jgi:hypothetical protein